MGDLPIDETHSYLNALFNYKSGDTISIELKRNDKTIRVQVTLAEMKN